jgi:flagellar biosynthesis regulator FlbT
MKIISLEAKAYELDTKAAKRFRDQHDTTLYAFKDAAIVEALINLEKTFGAEILVESLRGYIDQLDRELERGA